ncbi:thiamine pyrophosphate-binding protein [Sphingomonas bacterium]|uniref:thiamine pyrophosphate-binding protein n=1 Tax=Sphingomonas bacterium TaxID=1895847 RepID=UPI0020C65781|nr:thiamine pyrophosphate-binding protein [Sphingomonas bacterium]
MVALSDLTRRFVAERTVEPLIVLDFDGVLFNSASEAWSVCNRSVAGRAGYRQDVSFDEFMAFRAVVTDAWQYNRLHDEQRRASPAELATLTPDQPDRDFATRFFAARAAMMEDADWPRLMAPYDFFHELRPLLVQHPDRFAILSTRDVASIHRTLAFHEADVVPVFGQEDVRRHGSKLAVAEAQGWLDDDARPVVYLDDMRAHLQPFAGRVHRTLHAGWGYDQADPDSLDPTTALALLRALLTPPAPVRVKYADQIARWLAAAGYTHYFYVGGGNIMHLTESLDRHLTGVPVVHEVAAGIAAEYFNEIAAPAKALALVTAGPGLTNIVTALAGAYLESRELLVLGGQVKTADLARGQLRSRGIQEIDGVALVRSTTKLAWRFETPIGAADFLDKLQVGWTPRKGPVFLEIPLDVQAATVDEEPLPPIAPPVLPLISEAVLDRVAGLYDRAERPVVLIGGGVSHAGAAALRERLLALGVPTMTTYNGADRLDGDDPVYLGRPNTWGQRASNIVIQRADLIIAIGTRLGLQQTGFNWRAFGRDATIVQVEIDPGELAKGHPRVDLGLAVDADDVARRLFARPLARHDDWLAQARRIRDVVPRVEPVNTTGEGFLSPYDFIVALEPLTRDDDLIIPCSSGSAFTLSMQLYRQRFGQRLLTNKSLASMGYGLSGAIGAAIGGGGRRTILIEGDGGFAQNLQELGTVAVNDLDLKIFIFDDGGHASIRMTQRSYFGGKYLGCDRRSGLGLPDWRRVFAAWDVPVLTLGPDWNRDPAVLARLDASGPAAFIVPVDPEQTYFPKITSRITATGSMESNPIDRMTPEIDYLAGC